MSISTTLARLLEARQLRQAARKHAVHPFTGKPLRSGDILDAYPAGASESQLCAFSTRTGVSLPSSLKAWLTITNGAAGFFGVPPTDNRCQIESIWCSFPCFRERNWIPVARDNFGNFYVQISGEIGSEIEPVLYVETIGDYIAYATASNMLRFAVFYLEGEVDSDYHWPLDKKFVLDRDPKLVEVAYPRIWDG